MTYHKKRGKVWKLFVILIALWGCHEKPDAAQMEQWKAEIMAVEQEFDAMAQKDGLPKAFEHYAAKDGVIRRQRKVIKGKKAIGQWYLEDARPNETLTWKPTFIDVSQSGDLAYTYGEFTFKYPDSLGNLKTSTGIFHTVWKRQADGSWRFVWD